MPPNNIFARDNVMSADVRDLAEAQRGLKQLIQNVSANGDLEGHMVLALGQLHRYASSIVHVDTGRLKNSLFVDTERSRNDLIGYVATNVEYAPMEEGRGGSHAFFGRTVAEEGPRAVGNLFNIVTDI